MIGKNSIHTFDGGMNQDTARDKLKSNQYYESLNINIVTEAGLSTGSIENEKGNKSLFTLLSSVPPVFKIEATSIGVVHIYGNAHVSIVCGATVEETYNDIINNSVVKTAINNGEYKVFNKTDYVLIVGLDYPALNISSDGSHPVTTEVSSQTNISIVGWGEIRDYVLLFTTDHNNTTESPSGTIGQIWKFKYDVVNECIDSTYLNLGYLKPSTALVYNGELDFSIANQVRIEASYKNSDVIKIYFWDGYNSLRHINIVDEESLALTSDKLSMVGDVSFFIPVLKEVSAGGSHKAGTVQYAYQLYDENGSETVLSPVSNLIHLSDSSETEPYSDAYYGIDSGEDAGKSVIVEISNIDINFDYIRLFSIYYSDFYSTPTIRTVIEKGVYGNTSMVFTDNGSDNIGTLTLQQFRGMGSVIFNPQTLRVKDNILFAGDVNEEFFEITEEEWDSRAYRWNDSNSTARIENADGSYKDINISDISSDPDHWNVLLDHDCIQDRTAQSDTYRFKRVSPTAYLGGTGPNVNYEFKLEQIIIDKESGGVSGDTRILRTEQESTPFITLNEVNYEQHSFTNYASPYKSGLLRGYMRGETYRYGIVFRSTKGIYAPVRWIADIKMPDISENDRIDTYTFNSVAKKDFSTVYYDGATNPYTTYANVLYPEFEVSIPASIIEKISGYQIVRVKREDNDKNKRGQGLLIPAHQVTIPTQPNHPLSEETYHAPADILKTDPYANLFNASIQNLVSPTYSCDVAEFISPEVNFHNDFDFIVGDYYEMQGTCNPATDKGVGGVQVVNKIHRIFPHSGELTSPEKIDITKAINTAPYTGTSTEFNLDAVGGYLYYPVATRWETGPGNVYWSYSMSNMASSIDFDNDDSWDTSHIAVVNYCRDVTNQYGGNTYAERVNSTYIGTGHSRSISEVGIYTDSVYGGDTFISFFDYLRMAWRDIGDYGGEYQEVVYMPVETTINTELRSDTPYNRANTAYLQEKAGNYPEVGGTPNYVQAFNLYQYNTAYSKVDDSKVFLPKPLQFDDNFHYDGRIRASQQKIADELGDSWLTFLPEDKIDVDSKHGSVTNLITFKDALLFSQASALGILAVNERALHTLSGTDATLVLGTGGVLDDYTYISTKSGSIHTDSMVEGLRGLYYYDARNNKIMLYKGTNIPLSDVKGMSSYLNNNISRCLLEYDRILLNTGVTATEIDNKIIYTFKDYDSGKAEPITAFTLSYNELLDNFESFHSYTPGLYLKHKGRLLTINPITTVINTVGYVQWKGDYNNFYGTLYPSYVTTLFNSDAPMNKMFNNLAWMSTVTKLDSGSTVELEETFQNLEFWNAYQTQTNSLTVDDNVKKRLRTWRTQILKDTNNKRFRDHYLFTKFSFDNNSDSKRLVIDEIGIWYLLNIQ